MARQRVTERNIAAIRDVLPSNWKALLLVIPPVIAGLGGVLLLSEIVTEVSIATPHCWVPADIAAAETATRMQMAGALAMVSIAAGAALLAAWLVASTHLRTSQMWVWRILILVVFVVAFLVLINNGSDVFYRHLVSGVFQHTVEAGPFVTDSASPCSQPTDVDFLGMSRKEMIDRLVKCSSVVAVGLSVTIVFAVPSLAPDKRTGQPAPDKIELMVKTIAAKNRDLKYLLFGTAAFLFTGLIHLKAWTSWPLAYWTAITVRHPSAVEAGKRAYEMLQGALINYEAICYVLLMVATFLPIGIWLRVEARYVASHAPEVVSGKIKADEWLAVRGVDLTLSEQAQRAAALLSPFLVEPLSALLKSGFG